MRLIGRFDRYSLSLSTWWQLRQIYCANYRQPSTYVIILRIITSQLRLKRERLASVHELFSCEVNQVTSLRKGIRWSDCKLSGTPPDEALISLTHFECLRTQTQLTLDGKLRKVFLSIQPACYILLFTKLEQVAIETKQKSIQRMHWKPLYVTWKRPNVCQIFISSLFMWTGLFRQNQF